MRATLGKLNWQPIETAPKDGTDILVYYEKAGIDFVHIASWLDYFPHEGETDPGWWSNVQNSVGIRKLDGLDTPTHCVLFNLPNNVL